MYKEELLKTYPRKNELHLHTMPASSCCTSTTERTLELYGEIGVDTICITNHFFKDSKVFSGKTKKDGIDSYLSDYETLKEAAKPYGIKALLGCEIRFSDSSNDYLIYGVNRSILEEAFDYLPYTVEDFRKNVILKDSLFIQAHPFRKGITPVNPSLVDGIESLNMHAGHNNRCSVSAFYAKENNIGICVGGSDFHNDLPYYAGGMLMLSKTLPDNSFELANIIKSKDYIFKLGDNHIIIP